EDQVACLQLSFPFKQTEMNTQQMYAIGDGAVQEATLREVYKRGVNVIPADKGQFTQNGIAVVTVLLNCVLAVGVMRPDSICQELHLRLVGPVSQTFAMQGMVANNFLEEHQVGITGAKMVADMRQHQAFGTHAESFVNIQRQHTEMGL
ncbi:MAG TPA: hypothetical protein DEG76_00915, partial [Pseudohongiella sp.]|nr:hypothetical protein [Pseudohongiella sp.]